MTHTPMKKILLILVIFLSIGIFGAYYWFHGITNKIFIPHAKFASATVNSIQEHLAEKTPFTIALLGYGGGNHDGAYLTDSIMVVHIDPKTQKIFLISIPRDIWIKIPTDGKSGSYWKINAAYSLGLDDINYPNKQAQFKGADGGGKLAEYTIGQVIGLPIDYFVGMDFSGFKHTIDTLGGVDVTVETAFTDPQYPIDGKEDDSCKHTDDDIKAFTATDSAEQDLPAFFPCRYLNLHFNAGLQHMDGETALEYVRSRHSTEDGTDFGRAKRQRNLLVAVKQKIFSAGVIPQIIPFMTSLGDDFKTDLSLDDVRVLLQNASSLNKYSIETLALTDQNYLMDTQSSNGQDILAPKDGLDNWTSVHTYLSDTFSGKPQPVAALVQVENGTTVAGLAGIATNRLKAENITTLDPINDQNQNVKFTTITLLSKNINKADVAIIEKEFGVKEVSYQSASKQTQYNILVILGNDYYVKEGKKVNTEP